MSHIDFSLLATAFVYNIVLMTVLTMVQRKNELALSTQHLARTQLARINRYELSIE